MRAIAAILCLTAPAIAFAQQGQPQSPKQAAPAAQTNASGQGSQQGQRPQVAQQCLDRLQRVDQQLVESRHPFHHGLAELQQGSVLQLPYPFLADAQLPTQLLQRGPLLAEAAFPDDGAFARAQLAQRVGQPLRPGGRVAHADHHILRRRALVGQEILPVLVRPVGDGGVQRLVAGRQPHLHRLHIGDVDLQLLGDPGASLLRQPLALGRVLDAGAQAAQVEEEGFLRGGGAGADDRPVAQDVVLHGRTDPPRGVGGEAHLAVRLEPAGGLHQPDIAFLNQIAHRQTVVAEP